MRREKRDGTKRRNDETETVSTRRKKGVSIRSLTEHPSTTRRERDAIKKRQEGAGKSG
jgi:hypothetical protein